MKSVKKFILESQAFTLIELVVVITVLSILLSISLPKHTLKNYKLKSDVRVLASDIRRVRYLSMTKGKYYSLFLRENAYTLYEEKAVIKEVDLKNTTVLKSFNGNISFSHKGSPKTGGTLVISDNSTNKSHKITLVPFTGRVLVKEGD